MTQILIPTITLKRGREDSLQRRHPWIFSGAVERVKGQLADGDLVRVLSSKGDVCGVGHYGTGSIMVRMLAFEDALVDLNFWKQKLAQALSLRKQIGLADCNHTSAYRLVHGEGDGMPGLIIDVYGKTAVMQAHSAGMHRARIDLCEALPDVMDGRIENVYYKSEGTLPRAYRTDGNISRSNHELQTMNYELPALDSYLYGGTSERLCQENGMLFEVDWERGQKTGFFVDQRDNRQLLGRFAAGGSVLNMFCYTGGFSVSALRGGATRVVSVDSSERAIQQTNRNVALNFPSCPQHEAVCMDAFKYLGSTDELFDVVVLDPPAFAKHRGALHNALKGYTRLNVEGLKRVRPGGILFTFSCSQVVTKDHFRGAVLSAAAQAGRSATILYQLHQPADHPISVFHPEGEYLKGLVLRIE